LFGFKRQYKDRSGIAGCIHQRIPSQYIAAFALAPHGGVWSLTITHGGSRIVEEEYIGREKGNGLGEIEWRRTRQAQDDRAALTKAAEAIVQRCATPVPLEAHQLAFLGSGM